MTRHRSQVGVWIVLAAAAAAAMVAGALSAGGGAISSPQQLGAQLGVRNLQPVPSNLAPGAIVQVEVLDATKLAKFGITAPRGTRLRLVVVEPGKRFRLELGAQKRLLALDQKGILAPVQ